MLGRVGSSQEFTELLLREQTSSLNHAQRRGGDGEIQQQPHGADHSVGFLLPLHLRTVASSQKSAPVQPLASGPGAFLLFFVQKRIKCNISMNSTDSPKGKKKLGCFYSSAIFITSFFLICLFWSILQIAFDSNYLPTQTGTIFRKWNSDPSFLAFMDSTGIILCIILPTYLLFRKTVNLINRRQKDIQECNRQNSKKWKIILFVLGEILLYFICINYLFSSAWYDYSRHWMALWMCVCVGVLILRILKYIFDAVKKGILFYREEYPEKALSCFIIALLLVAGWGVILNYGMCLPSNGDTFLYILDKIL